MRYRWKTRPYRHQVQAILTLIENGWGGALLMSPRTGKTKVAIDYFSLMHQAGKINRVVVICPVSVMGVWIDEIHLHSPVKDILIVEWDRQGRREIQLPKAFKGLTVVLMNYEAFSRPGPKLKSGRRSKKAGRWKIYNLLARWKPDCVILDESHRIKNPKAKKTTLIHKLGKITPYRLILTGTAVTKKKRIFDVWSQWKFLNPERFKEYTFTEFRREVAVFREADGYPQWLRNKKRAVQWVREEIHQDSFAVTRDECFDLPARFDQPVPVELDTSAPTYRRMAEDMIARIESGEYITAQIKLTQMLRLAQITGGVGRTEPTQEYPRGRLVRIGREKLTVLEELLNDLFEADEKVVVAARFRADLASIRALCKKLKVPNYVLAGGISRQDRELRIKQFRAKGEAAAFIMQPQAGGLGIDLSTASNMIWYSLTNSWVDYTQSCDRIALSARKTSFQYLLVPGTVDELLYESLQEDADIAKAVTDSPEKLLRNFKG